MFEHEASLLNRQQAFGYTQEDIARFLEPMAITGDDPIGSMGTDTPIAVLSRRSRLLYDYFKQNFAQVTNPPIDPIREELVMSLTSMIGPRPNLLGHARHAQGGQHQRCGPLQRVLPAEGVAKGAHEQQRPGLHRVVPAEPHPHAEHQQGAGQSQHRQKHGLCCVMPGLAGHGAARQILPMTPSTR